ncbi:MAG: hypothetical protein JSW05_08680 [Candidatus Thorarchaeota archaeon]|nr:MAG: hypothetical protein JSW05_08680 [Candidatus Thorarchaeota archaeon]
MQSVVQVYSFVVITNALFFQGILIYIVRKGRNNFLDDISHFRRPSSALSRYYSWRVTKLRNALLETVLFETFLISSIVGIVAFAGILHLLLSLSPVILFVVILSTLTSLQMSWRVRGILDREQGILNKLSGAEDKIGLVEQMVDELYQAGAYADGRIWFALFKITLREDPIGWSVRDVLMDKSRKIVDRIESHIAETTDTGTPKSGPEIE